MITHVTVHTAKLHETVEFYQWFLDLPIEMEFQSPMGGEIIVLGGGEAGFELISDENAEIISAPALSFGVAVEDLDEKITMLESKGITHSGILSPMPRARFVFFNDLNGCEIQLVERKMNS